MAAIVLGSPTLTPGGATTGRRRDGAERLPGKVFRWKRVAWAALPGVTAAVAAFVVGTGYLAVTDSRAGPGARVGRWLPAVAAAEPSRTRPFGDPFGGVPVLARSVPTRLRIAAIGLDADLERLHLSPAGVLSPPTRYEHAGWYADGTVPGDVGPAVIAGHVDSWTGPAVFYRLRELSAGDRIDVLRGGAIVSFTITRKAWYPKSAFPTARVYGPTPDRQLRLITCGGAFNHRLRAYRDNLVVYAVAG